MITPQIVIVMVSIDFIKSIKKGVPRGTPFLLA